MTRRSRRQVKLSHWKFWARKLVLGPTLIPNLPPNQVVGHNFLGKGRTHRGQGVSQYELHSWVGPESRTPGRSTVAGGGAEGSRPYKPGGPEKPPCAMGSTCLTPFFKWMEPPTGQTLLGCCSMDPGVVTSLLFWANDGIIYCLLGTF